MGLEPSLSCQNVHFILFYFERLIGEPGGLVVCLQYWGTWRRDWLACQRGRHEIIGFALPDCRDCTEHLPSAQGVLFRLIQRLNKAMLINTSLFSPRSCLKRKEK